MIGAVYRTRALDGDGCHRRSETTKKAKELIEPELSMGMYALVDLGKKRRSCQWIDGVYATHRQMK